MFPPFKEDFALRICTLVTRALEEGVLELRPVDEARKSTERTAGGIMIGAMVCSDAEGALCALVAPSGTTRALFRRGEAVPLESLPPLGFAEVFGSGLLDGALCTLPPSIKFVPPIAGAKEIDEALLPNDREIHELTERILVGGPGVQMLKERRSALTGESLSRVFALYSFHCADGRMRSLKEICSERGLAALPPCGTGECSAPKLLDAAFASSLLPQSLCEVFYRKGCEAERSFPCDKRCAIILPSILGLEILYRDDAIAVVNKPSGLLSIPGRGPEKLDSVTTRLRRLFPSCIPQPSVHRLDMETSGLMVLAFTKEAHRNLSIQFMEGRVQKKYTALLDGVLAKKGFAAEGTMELYFRLDVDHRPLQVWDSVYGKKAVTSWRILDVERYSPPALPVRNVTRVEFVPHTGRTHQLRLASADGHGFATPIVGDSLYGSCCGGERLMLHACSLEFEHPVTKKPMSFASRAPF